MIKIIETKFGSKKVEMVKWNEDYIPKTVYKYRDWENKFHKKIVTEREIFVPSPEKFNDPFDCKINVNYEMMIGNKELQKLFINNHINECYPNISDNRKKHLISKILNSRKLDDKTKLELIKNQSIKESIQKVGIFCVTPINDNILMWAHYANNHEGICIGFRTEELFKKFGAGSLVVYENSYPQISPTLNKNQRYFKLYHTKSDIWDYEIEYRLSKFDFANKKMTVSEKTISEIIFGFKTDKDTRNEIIRIVKKKFLHVRFYEVIPKNNSFELLVKEYKI